jgi:hypothetical protein
VDCDCGEWRVESVESGVWSVGVGLVNFGSWVGWVMDFSWWIMGFWSLLQWAVGGPWAMSVNVNVNVECHLHLHLGLGHQCDCALWQLLCAL